MMAQQHMQHETELRGLRTRLAVAEQAQADAETRCEAMQRSCQRLQVGPL